MGILILSIWGDKKNRPVNSTTLPLSINTRLFLYPHLSLALLATYPPIYPHQNYANPTLFEHKADLVEFI